MRQDFLWRVMTAARGASPPRGFSVMLRASHGRSVIHAGADLKITVETTVDGPIEEVWRAWTTPEDITKWNAASDDWHTPSATVDLREGGMFSSRMEAKDGSMGFDFAGTYMRVVPHELIECALGDRVSAGGVHRRR